jgi:hypothetical protein
MAPVELEQLCSVVDSIQPRTVAEWGSGGSTVELLRRYPCIERMISIEHDRAWWERTAAEVNDPRLTLILHEPQWPPKPGWWEMAERDPDWLPEYVTAPRNTGLQFDFILVDGRARRFCLAEAIELVNPCGAIVLHDAQRRVYQDVIPADAEFLEPWKKGQVCVIRT